MDLRSGVSYWRAIDPTPLDYPSLVEDATCDVAIVGGGITGALVGHSLAREGVNTLLVDRREFGTGSTAASTGLLQYEIDVPLVDLIAKVGEAHAVRAYRRGLRAIDEIEMLVEELGDPCDFARRSTLYFASRPADLRGLRDEFECRQHFGFTVEFWDRAELQARSSINAAGAIYSAGDGQIDPFRLTRRVLERAAGYGLRVFAKSTVRKVHAEREGIVLATETGRIMAGAVVYAAGYEAGPFSSSDVGILHSTYALASRPLKTSPGWPEDCLIWETARPYFYARKTRDGRAIIGGADTPHSDDHQEPAFLEKKAAELLERFGQLFPLIEFDPDCVWAGTFGETRDGLAFIGSQPGRPREYFALGYGGNGITFSQIAARLIVDLFCGRANEDAAVFRFGR